MEEEAVALSALSGRNFLDVGKLFAGTSHANLRKRKKEKEKAYTFI